MQQFLLVTAYILIWTTPVQVGFCLWAFGVVLSTDATILYLTNDVFMGDNLPFLYKFLKPFTYFIYPDVLADFVWSLPSVIHGFFKAVVSTWLGSWLLRRAKRMPSPQS